jgi:hypothetical protein
MIPKLAMGNIFPDHETLKGFARSYGFSGIEWSFDLETLPRTPLDESEWLKQIAVLRPIECASTVLSTRLIWGTTM